MKPKADNREQAAASAHAVAPRASVAEELALLAELKEPCLLSEEVLAAQKTKLLS